MSELCAILNIRQEIAFSEYAFSYTDWSRNVSQSWTAGFTSAETRDLHQELGGFCQRPSVDRFVQIQSILNQLLPEKLKAELLQRPPTSLALVSDECCLPWEWMGVPELPLFCSCNLTRELSQRASSWADVHQEQLFFLVADTLTKQSGCDEDINLAWGLLRDAECKVVQGTGTATRESVEDVLYGDRFGMVYAACPGLSRLELGGSSLAPRESQRDQRVGPRMVFVHNYVRPARPDLHLFEAAQQWANSLCASGCEAFLTNLWSGTPGAQRKMTRAFFSALTSGMRLGEALQTARRELWEKGAVDAAAYVILGNAQLRLADLRPMRVRESTTMPGGLTSLGQLQILSGPESGRVVPLFANALRQRGLVIGSSGARSCDIELDDSLPNQTASLSLQNETLVLRNLTETPHLVQVNGLSVRKEIALCVGEQVQFGPIKVQLQSNSQNDAVPTESLRAFCLEVHDQQDQRTVWYDDDLVILGRGASSKLSFNDVSVSRNHALLQRSGEALVVSRVGSNVVAVNGVPLEFAQELNVNDLVQLSDHAFFKVMRIVAE
ncbi:FHA domain-containing protein [bacterium]|nr:FHA domain-containing protein [bacterium]